LPSRAADEVAVFEHLQRRINRSGAWAQSALLFDGQHDVVAVARSFDQRFEDLVLEIAASAPAAPAAAASAASRAAEGAFEAMMPVSKLKVH